MSAALVVSVGSLRLRSATAIQVIEAKPTVFRQAIQLASHSVQAQVFQLSSAMASDFQRASLWLQASA